MLAVRKPISHFYSIFATSIEKNNNKNNKKRG